MDVSFSADQLRRVLGSAEGKQLLALLAADGGGRLRQAAEAVKAGDHARAQAILQPVLQTEQAQALLQKLSRLAPRVVLTGVSFDDDRLGAMSYDRTTGRYFAYYNEKVHAGFHGTGDIFTATVLGAMMQGRTLEQAVTLAVDFTLECIRCTCADPAASWYGVEFEKALPWLARQNNAGAE